MPDSAAERHPARWLLWLLPALAVVVLDQFTKQWVSALLQPSQTLEVTSFFKLVLWFNTGAAFSFLADADGWQRLVFVAIAVVAAVVIVRLLYRHPEQGLFCAGLSLILGGALGNLWDRIAHGHVVDFLLFHAGGWYFPAFNVADSAITVGAALIIIDGFMPKSREASRKSD